MTPPSNTPPSRISPLARFGPLVAIVVAIAIVGTMASTGDGGSKDSTTTNSVTKTAGSKDMPITWNAAKKAGTLDKYDWGPRCDPKTGRVKVPSFYAPPCQVKRPGSTGGATYAGVTADKITVVLYEAADDDLSASLQSKSDSAEAVRQNRIEMLRALEGSFEMWGRTLDIVPFKGTGSDETSARADAVKVATEIKAFASVGGPGQQGAYGKELASRGVICVGCGLALPDATYQEYSPYLWGSGQTAEQFLLNLGDYTVNRMNGRKAKFAGDPKMRTQKRRFGAVHFEQDPPVFDKTEDMVAARGEKAGYKNEVTLTYQLVIAQLGEKARTIVARLKEAKVTTVVFLGDPIMPIYLTKAATEQNYFPEWVITGTVLTDTTVFGRLYDQKQWAHAFGISAIPARLPQDQSDAWRTYRWYYGKDPGAPKTVAVNYEPIRITMLGISMAGPHLTPATFRNGLFAYPPTKVGVTGSQISFGRHGFFPDPDHLAVDDMQEIWWDAKATGPDEQGVEGTGMLRYADGGKRYLPGKMPKTDIHAFIRKGAVLGYKTPPPGEVPPSYPRP